MIYRIAKNVSGGYVDLSDLGDLRIPASGQIDLLRSGFSFTEISNSSSLITEITSGNVVLSDGTSDLSISDALNFLSLVTQYANPIVHDCSSGHTDWVLTDTEANAVYLTIVNSDAAVNVVLPSINKFYYIFNNTDYVVKVKTTTSVTDLIISCHKNSLVSFDGLNYTRSIDPIFNGSKRIIVDDSAPQDITGVVYQDLQDALDYVAVSGVDKFIVEIYSLSCTNFSIPSLGGLSGTILQLTGQSSLVNTITGLVTIADDANVVFKNLAFNSSNGVPAVEDLNSSGCLRVYDGCILNENADAGVNSTYNQSGSPISAALTTFRNTVFQFVQSGTVTISFIKSANSNYSYDLENVRFFHQGTGEVDYALNIDPASTVSGKNVTGEGACTCTFCRGVYTEDVMIDPGIYGLEATANIITSPRIKQSLLEIDDAISQQYRTGFADWDTGVGDYWSFDPDTNIFSLLRSGYGYVMGKKTLWLGSQTVEITPYEVTFISVDSSGILKAIKLSEITGTTFLFNIPLFQGLRSSDDFICGKSNVPYYFEPAISAYIKRCIGGIIRGSGANLDKVGVGTGGDPSDRYLQLRDYDHLEAAGLLTYIPAYNPLPFILAYLGVDGYWRSYTSYRTPIIELPMIYNNAGTPTAIPEDKYGIFRLYIGLDDLNTSYAQPGMVINNAIYDTVEDARKAITDRTVQALTNEFLALDLPQLGYAIVLNNASGGYVYECQVEKSSFPARLIGTSWGGSGATDHGLLDGLLNDTHPQYLTTARHAAITGNPHGTTLSQAYTSNRVVVVDNGALRLDATGTGYAPVELTDLSVIPSVGLASGQLASVNGRTFIYDGSRGKWLSTYVLTYTWGRPGNSRLVNLNIHGVSVNSSGYKIAADSVVVSIQIESDTLTAVKNNAWALQKNGGINVVTGNVSNGVYQDSTLNVNVSAGDYLTFRILDSTPAGENLTNVVATVILSRRL